MNKYQGALDRLLMWATNGYCALEVPSAEYEDLKEIMQELVDKATPKAPTYEGDGYDDEGNMIYDTWICPNCDTKYEVDYQKYDYCPNCGQHLDWSEEEENCDEE